MTAGDTSVGISHITLEVLGEVSLYILRLHDRGCPPEIQQWQGTIL